MSLNSISSCILRKEKIFAATNQTSRRISFLWVNIIISFLLCVYWRGGFNRCQTLVLAFHISNI